jgi:non-ribosomal peptide synthase protein (TIGR01720 family)
MKEAWFPLLPEQIRFLGRDLPEVHHWNATRLFRVPSELSPSVLGRAFLSVVNQHDALRTHLAGEGGRTWGRATGQWAHVDVIVLDLGGLSAVEQINAITRQCSDVQASISLYHPPLFRLAYLVLSPTERRVLLTMHHFIIDNVSLPLLIAELDYACRLTLAGREIGTSSRAPSVTAYAGWMRELAGNSELNKVVPLWKELASPVEPVPLEHNAENTLSTAGNATAALGVVETTHLLTEVLPAIGADIRAVILTTAVSTLHGSGREHSLQALLLGHGRTGLPGQPDMTDAIGWLETAYPVSVRLNTFCTLSEQLVRTRDVLRQVPHQGASYGVLRYMSPDSAVRTALASTGTPQLMVDYHGQQSRGTSQSLLTAADEWPGPHTTLVGPRVLTHVIDVSVCEGKLQVTWHYSTQQFSPTTVAGYLEELLDRINQGLCR